MQIRASLGIHIGRAVHKGMRLLGRESTALPGYVAERIDPSALRAAMKGREYAYRIVVTGTNGKTTTTLLIKNILEQAGYKVINNSSGSNLSRGVLTTVLKDKRQGSDAVLLLEVDEASMPIVVDAVAPTQIVVLNLFRDQLDRYGEVTTTQALLVDALGRAQMAQLILNADDPWVAQLSQLTQHSNVEYYGLGIKGLTSLPHDTALDLPLSHTGASIIYSQKYFGHLGKYRAEDGSFKRPRPAVEVVTADQSRRGQGRVTLTMYKKQHKLRTNLLGIYNTYNIAAAVLTSLVIEVDPTSIRDGIEHTKPAFGRQEEVLVSGLSYQFQLIKNPTGFNQIIQQFCRDSKDASPIVFVINDNFADGRDVSWLWDVAIEDIATGGPCIVSGIRAYDMALRLEYAGIPCRVIPGITDALEYAAQHTTNKRVRVLPTYTSLLAIRKQLSLKLEHVA